MSAEEPINFEGLDDEHTPADPTVAGDVVRAELERTREVIEPSAVESVCVTVSCYALGKRLGLERGLRELERQIQAPTRESIPAARAIARLRNVAGLVVRCDTGGTLLGMVRSQHAHYAWMSGAQVWLSIDDDVEATTPTLRDLVDATIGPVPRIVVAPCMTRQGGLGLPMVNVDLPRIVSSERVLSSGARLRPIRYGGLGLVAMNRAALEEVREACAHLAYVSADGVERLALFHDELRDGQWLGEDVAFFSRVPKHVEVEALLTGYTSHAGQPLSLGELG